MISRRLFLLGLPSLVGAGGLWACAGTRAARGGGPVAASAGLAAIERGLGGRLGVHAFDTGSGRAVGHRDGERFALCSTFKWALAAVVLERVDRGGLALDRRLPFGAADLLEYAPVTRARLADGALSVEDLCAAAVTVSDNTAANLLLDVVGGPAQLTAALRRLGDPTTRLDRREPELNSDLPGDERDTTTPRAMAALLGRVLLGDALAAPSRQRLTDWMVAATTGLARLRAGLPTAWRVADKTGTGRDACNDVAIAWPPGRAPLCVAAYCRAPRATAAEREAALAAAARTVASALD